MLTSNLPSNASGVPFLAELRSVLSLFLFFVQALDMPSMISCCEPTRFTKRFHALEKS